jgi:hypothetical protein
MAGEMTNEERLRNWIDSELGDVDEVGHFADGTLHVIAVDNQPAKGAVTFLTIGLSRHLLEQPSGPIRQELLMSCWRDFERLPIADLLAQVAGEVALSCRALLEGAVLRAPTKRLEGTDKVALLCSVPRYMGDAVYRLPPMDPPLGIVWLVPLTRQEADFALDRGWHALTDRFEQVDPDLLNFKRKGIRLT